MTMSSSGRGFSLFMVRLLRCAIQRTFSCLVRPSSTHRNSQVRGRPAVPPSVGGPFLASRRTKRFPLAALLLALALVFAWDLDVSGTANVYYSAAAQAGAESWKAMFFGSLVANAVTVDKPPFALWPMDLSVRMFGLTSWSVLLPQAVEGVACVAVLYDCVRRSTGAVMPAVLAGVAFTLTPVVALVFRYNNPDAMLTLLLVGAGYATLRSLDGHRSTRWIALAGALCGIWDSSRRCWKGSSSCPPSHSRSSSTAEVDSCRDSAVSRSRGSRSERWPVGGSRSSRCGPWSHVRSSAARRATPLSRAWGYNGVERITGSSGGVLALHPTSTGSVAPTSVPR